MPKRTKHQLKILAILDDRNSSNIQVETLSNAMSDNVTFVRLKYRFIWNILRFFPKCVPLGIKDSSELLQAAQIVDHDLIITCGGRMEAVGIYLKRFGMAKLVHIMKPNCFQYDKFDLILAPNHDKISEKHKNVIRYQGALVELNQSKIRLEAKRWNHIGSMFVRPYISVFIGGETKNCKFDDDIIYSMVNGISNIATKMNGTLLITTSRRTSINLTDAIRNEIVERNSCYFYDFNARNAVDNMYFAFVGLADYIIVTPDSISMITELVSTRKPVYVIEAKVSGKHKRFINDAKSLGSIQMIKLDGSSCLSNFISNQLNDIDDLVCKISEYLELR